MTNGSYQVNGKSNFGYVDSESSDLPGAFTVNDDNRNNIESAMNKGQFFFITRNKPTRTRQNIILTLIYCSFNDLRYK